MNRPLELSITEQGVAPHFRSCYLSASSHRLFPMTPDEALAIADLIREASGQSGAIVAWDSPEDERFGPAIPGMQEVDIPRKAEPEEGTAQSWTFCAFREEPAEVATLLRTVWNSFEEVHVYPASSDGVMTQIVAAHRADDRDEKAAGLGWQEGPLMRSRSGCLSLSTGCLGTIGFALRLLLSPGFRDRLTNPFLQASSMDLVEKLGAFFWKGSHDDSISLGFLCGNRDIAAAAKRVFDERGIPLGVESGQSDSNG